MGDTIICLLLFMIWLALADIKEAVTERSGVFLQPTGSHETDPFIEEEADE